MKKIVVDIGGSGIRIARVVGGALGQIKRPSVHSMSQLADAIISEAGGKPYAVAVSVPGFVNAYAGTVRLCRLYPWAQGGFSGTLAERLGTKKVFLVNDGEAHALAMLKYPGIRFGAICLSFGTSVGFGMIDSNKKIVRSLSGENWDIGGMRLRTSCSTKEAWYALGSSGLKELEHSIGTNAYPRFGYRLGAFLGDLTEIFHPLTIALTGGIIQKHWAAMQNNALQEMKSHVYTVEAPGIVALQEKETALVGLIQVVNY